jgi:hypothetical protein
MHGMNPEHLDAEPSDRSLPADVLLRQEPDEGEEDDGDGNRDDGDADEGEGYSE